MTSSSVTAGGVMIEAFPGVPEETLERLEGRLAAFGSISRELAAAGLEGVLDSLLGGDRELHSAREIAYRCRCSRKRIRRYLEQLPPEDLRPPIEVTCAFCGETYTYRPEEVVPGELELGQ